MFSGIEVWQLAAGLVGTVAGSTFIFFGAMARFLKRPSPSEAIIRVGRATTDVFIARSSWIVPVLHRATTLSLSTIGLTIRRAGHDALVSKDYISTNLSAEFYIRVEPNEEDVKKAARTIGIDEGHANSEAVREKAQGLLEPKLVGALRAVAAQNEFLSLHLNREHFAQEVSNALREDLGRNGFTLESVTITELTQTPLSEMRADDIFGASGRETVTNTVVAKNIGVKRKQQEEAERTSEIEREQAIRVAEQQRLMREGKAQQEEAAIKAELAKSEAVETRDLQRQANIAVERAKKEQAELASEIGKQKVVEAARVDKERTIEAAEVDKQITLTLKAKESAEADAQKAAALSVLEKANQEVITVQRVAEAERERRVAVVAAEQQAQREKIAADVAAYKKKLEAEALATAQKAQAEGAAESVKIKATADANAATMQAEAITRLAEANREAGLKEAAVLREKYGAANGKSREVLLQEVALAALQNAPAIIRELVKPAEHIGEIKVLQLAGANGVGGNGSGGNNHPLLGSALGPVAKTLFEASAVMPLVQSMLQFADADGIKAALLGGASAGIAKPPLAAALQAAAAHPKVEARPPADGRNEPPPAKSPRRE
jgi:uncharacterized membrane protein YqiK